MNCEIGDIVYVDSYTYPRGTEGKYHFFVIMRLGSVSTVQYKRFIELYEKSLNQ